MTERNRSVSQRCVSFIAAAAWMALGSLTACSLPSFSKPSAVLPSVSGPPAATAEVQPAREAQPLWASAEYVDWLERRSMLEQSRRLLPVVRREV
jgi:hypothetical protein